MGKGGLTAGVFISIWRISCCFNGGITTAPVNITVVEDHNARFTCTAINTPFLFWKVNGTDLTDYPTDIQADFSIDGMRENNEETIVLVVFSRRKYNNTQIQCEARNLIGELIQTEIVILRIQDKFDFFISEVQYNLAFISDSAFSIQFVITGSQGLCDFEYVMSATGEKNGTPYNYTSQPSYLTRNTVTFTVLASELPYDAQYEMTLAVKHTNGSSLSSHQYTLSTFDVQSATIKVVDGTITISEQFAMNSSATGCFIVTSCDVGISKFMAVPINDGAGTVSGLEPGTCAVLVYDLERNGTPGIRPAVEIETIQVNGSSEELIFESDVLENVKLSVEEVDCGFKMGSDTIGCVVICLSNDDTSLKIHIFSSNDAFPMPANLHANLTCAVFGTIDGILERHPSVTVELSESPKSDGKDGDVVSITVIIVVTALASVVVAVVVGMVFMAHKKRTTIYFSQGPAAPTFPIKQGKR